ncbi:hypothetical protein GCM10018785_53070 [Streptomyces longispororuber]|uniref:Uncharacterized protein n=1 Tax=Streptomyces longispororuber TaxID=68230 RepID=A0A919A066_9ACTN|nr:hypothetical protein GCM10018785_53070 [Streptomyces longispororuber]
MAEKVRGALSLRNAPVVSRGFPGNAGAGPERVLGTGPSMPTGQFARQANMPGSYEGEGRPAAVASRVEAVAHRGMSSERAERAGFEPAWVYTPDGSELRSPISHSGHLSLCPGWGEASRSAPVTGTSLQAPLTPR